jgi:molybdopterin-containing oxidoreductase family iron-sulfur binding subunit
MKKRLLAKFPQAVWYEYEPISRDAELEGSRRAFGKTLRPILHLDKATAVVLLDADPLGTHPAHIRYAADWAERRRAATNDPRNVTMSRVCVAESTFSITGTVADVRLPIAPGRIYPILRAMAQSLGVPGITGEEKLLGAEVGFVAVAVKDLNKARADGAAVVAVGPTAPPIAHALAHVINHRLGAFGRCVSLIEDPA